MIFRTSFNISSISGANCLSSVCWVPHRTLHLQFDSQVDQRPLRFRFERFSHQSLSLVNYSENSRSRLFKVIIKLLCAHCFSSLGTLYFFFLRVKKSFLSVSRCIWVLEINIWNTFSYEFFCLQGCPVLSSDHILDPFEIFGSKVQWFNGSMVPWFHGHLWLQRCVVSGSLSCRACFSLRSNPPFSFALI